MKVVRDNHLVLKEGVGWARGCVNRWRADGIVVFGPRSTRRVASGTNALCGVCVVTAIVFAVIPAVVCDYDHLSPR